MVNLSMNYSNLSEQGLSQEMVDKLGLDIAVKYNPFNFKLGDLFELGARKNPKRNFLFVSRLIGKHISVEPEIPAISGRLLADLFFLKDKSIHNKLSIAATKAIKGEIPSQLTYELIEANKHSLPEKTLFIGFAETATGLGHSVFNSFENNNFFIHTTREKITELKSVFDFEEEHSHATSHSCFGLQKDFFEQFTNIVLVDDEVTTGNTAMNLIKSLNKFHPNKKYAVLSILDWRQEEDLIRIEKETHDLGVSIEFVSILGGSVSYTNQKVAFKESRAKPINVTTNRKELRIQTASREGIKLAVEEGGSNDYCLFTGRFGLDSVKNAQGKKYASELAETLSKTTHGKNILVLGTGECMFLPSLIASELKKNVTGNVVYHSTTRSPIYIMNESDYPIKSGFKYRFSNGGEVIDYFMYNVVVGKFDEVIMLGEVQMKDEEIRYIQEKLSQSGVNEFKYVLI